MTEIAKFCPNKNFKHSGISCNAMSSLFLFFFELELHAILSTVAHHAMQCHMFFFLSLSFFELELHAILIPVRFDQNTEMLHTGVSNMYATAKGLVIEFPHKILGI